MYLYICWKLQTLIEFISLFWRFIGLKDLRRFLRYDDTLKTLDIFWMTYEDNENIRISLLYWLNSCVFGRLRTIFEFYEFYLHFLFMFYFQIMDMMSVTYFVYGIRFVIFFIWFFSYISLILRWYWENVRKIKEKIMWFWGKNKRKWMKWMFIFTAHFNKENIR